MKKMIIRCGGILLLFILITTALAFTPAGEPEKGSYLTMRIYENFSVTSSRIIINYPDSTSEVIPIEPFKFNDDYLIRNGNLITKTLNRLKKRGYHVVTSVSDGKPTSSRNLMITTIIMEYGEEK